MFFNPGPAKATRPSPTVFCYICGRQFGSKSIAIHEPQCIKKWELEQKKLPKSQRRPLPVKPELPANGEPIDPEVANEMRWQASQANLVPCENCGRTFNPDRLSVHQRSCRPDNPAAKPPSKNR